MKFTVDMYAGKTPEQLVQSVKKWTEAVVNDAKVNWENSTIQVTSTQPHKAINTLSEADLTAYLYKRQQINRERAKAEKRVLEFGANPLVYDTDECKKKLWLRIMESIYKFGQECPTEFIPYYAAFEAAMNRAYVDTNQNARRKNRIYYQVNVGKALFEGDRSGWQDHLLKPSWGNGFYPEKLFPEWQFQSENPHVFLMECDLIDQRVEGLSDLIKEYASKGYTPENLFYKVKSKYSDELTLLEALRAFLHEKLEINRRQRTTQIKHENLVKSIRITGLESDKESKEFQMQKRKAEAWIRLNLFSNESDNDLIEFFLKRPDEYSYFIKEPPKMWHDVTQAKATDIDIFQREITKLGYDPRKVNTYDELIKVLDAKGYDFNEILSLLGVTIKDPFLTLWKDMITRVTGKKEPLAPIKLFQAKVSDVKDVKPLDQKTFETPLRTDKDPSHLQPIEPERTTLVVENPITATVKDANDVRDLSQANFNKPLNAKDALTHEQTFKPEEIPVPVENPIPETTKDASAIIKLNQKDFDKPRLDEQTEQTDEVPDKGEQPQDLGRVSGGKIKVTAKDVNDVRPLDSKAFTEPLQAGKVTQQQTGKTSDKPQEAKDYPQSTIDGWIATYAKMGLNANQIITRLSSGEDSVNFGDNVDLWTAHAQQIIDQTKATAQPVSNQQTKEGS
jgi:hypothetical protein